MVIYRHTKNVDFVVVVVAFVLFLLMDTFALI